MEFGSRTHEGLMRSIERRLSSLERRRSGSGAGLVGGGGIPTGTIITGAWQEAPGGWMICDGSAISRTGLTEGLFLAIGTAYGDGDGSTTFNLPDLRGRTPLGAGGGYGLGDTGGAETVALTSAQMPSHTHGTVAHTHVQNAHNHTQDAHAHTSPPHAHGQSVTAAVGGGTGIRTDYDGDPIGASAFPQGVNTDSMAAIVNGATATNQAATAVNQSASPDTTSTGAGGAHENMPPYSVLSYAIKL